MDTRQANEPRRETVAAVRAHIRAGWDSTVRRSGHDDHPRLYLPHVYTVPCPADGFQELFYWDTYFTNLGLLADGRTDLARGNVDNIIYLIGRFGFMPNSNAVHHLNRSQPPYLAHMIRDCYARTGDVRWLREVMEPLEQEYRFWSTRRSTPTGLARYLHDGSGHELAEFYATVLMRRLGLPSVPAEEARAVAYHYLAEAESGHDFTPRFQGRCADFAPVDLNANLYEYERLLARFSGELGLPRADEWELAAANRVTLMRRYLWHAERRVFCDYDYVNDAPSQVISAASFWPLAYGIATPDEARTTVRLLAQIERAHGVSTCEPVPGSDRRQWGYPNAWPPIQYMVAMGLRRYGYETEARRVATTYVAAVCAEFERSGTLWEKYDALTGEPATGEYAASSMLGWTAGVYAALVETFSLG